MQLHGGSSANAIGQHGLNGLLVNGAAVPSSRSMDRVLDEAQFTGELAISGRLMNKFPVSKHNLIDTSKADFSRNRFVEVPREIWQLVFLEYLNFRENLLRTIPPDICRLTCLIELDLSRNNISAIPASLCKLPLQILLMSHNRLTSLPAEIGQMRCLRELDVSCNEIEYLPQQIGQISTLRRLDLRRNKLIQLPIDFKKLGLVYLDISQNLISFLPTALSDMAATLETLHLSDNPLQSPPALLCSRGKIHIFKALQRSIAQRQPMPRDVRDVSCPRRFELPTQPPVRISPEKQPSPPLPLNKSIPGEIPPSTRQPASSSPATENVVYSVPPKLPVSTSCPLISKLPMQIAPASAEGSSTSSPSSSGVASGTDGASDEGVDSMTGNGDVDPLAAAAKPEKELGRKGSSSSTEPVKKPLTQTSSNGHRVNGSLLPPSSQAKPAVKPPVTVHRRLSNSSVTTTSARESPLLSISHPAASPAGTTTGDHSARTISARSLLPKPSALKKEQPAASIAKPRVSPGRSTVTRIGFTVEKTESTSQKDSNPNFTIRRQQEQIREEAEKLDMLKKYIETRLKLTLPDDVMDALQDGVVLCHLVNNIRPRSVISIHVPPNTQSGPVKLTPAKSRRNVENFMDACRRLGVPDVLICSSADILEGKSPAKIYGCVHNLLQLDSHVVKRGATTPAAIPPHHPRITSARAQPLRDSSAV